MVTEEWWVTHRSEGEGTTTILAFDPLKRISELERTLYALDGELRKALGDRPYLAGP